MATDALLARNQRIRGRCAPAKISDQPVKISDQVVLWCPLAPAIHPDFRVWEREAVAWMESFGLDGEQRDSGRLRHISVGELTGRTIHPAADPPGARFTADVLMWLFAFDDAYCDEGRYSHDPRQTVVLVAELARIAETGRTTSARPHARALADLRQQLDVLASPPLVARWVHTMKAYLGYQVWEASYRSANRMPTVDEFAVARIRNGAMEVSAACLEITEGYQAPMAETEGADVRALTEMACGLVGYDNDIASYHKEHARSDSKLNLVDVIAHERRQTPDAALPEAIAFRDAVLALYLELFQQVEPTVSDTTRRYMSGLSAWIRGNLDWSMNSARYRRSGKPTIRVSSDLARPVADITPPAGVAWWWSRLRPADARLRRNEADDVGEFAAGPDSELGEDLAQVVLHMARAEEQPGTDLGVGQALGR
jgi:terpene synthase-like protein